MPSTMKNNLREVLSTVIELVKTHFVTRSVAVEFYDSDKNQFPAPIILLDIEEIEEGKDKGDSRIPIECTLVAHCVLAADTPFLQFALRDFAAETMRLIRRNRWGLGAQATDPEDIVAIPVRFGPDNTALDAWRVSWRQTFYFGDSIWTDDGVVPSVVFIDGVMS